MKHLLDPAAKVRRHLEGRIETARLNGGPSAVTPRGANRYTVVGRAGDRYTVVVTGSYSHAENYACDCAAGLHGRDCWHEAAVWLLFVSMTAMASRKAA